jgi:hypothetical protein
MEHFAPKDHRAMADAHSNVPILYPKQINIYLQCPERYYHERIERWKVNQPISPALARGIASHRVLSEVANEREAHLDAFGVVAVAPDLLARSERALRQDA